MPRDRSEVLTKAEVLIDAMKNLDPVAMGALLAPESIVWHNTDGIELKRDEFLTGLEGLQAACKAVGCTADIEVLDRDVTTSGLAQTYRWFFRSPGRPAIELACAMWVTLNDKGEILRFEEYLDSVGANALNALLTGDGIANAD
jgi:hypothetical protein